MLDADLVAGIDRTARAVGMNRSEFVSEAVAARLGEQAAVVISRTAGNRVALSNEYAASKKVFSATSTVLSKTASKVEKATAASALTQTQTRSPNETTSKKVASAASKILHDPKASKAAKSAAASALTQKAKKK
jgi:hypothetical protein